MAYNPIVQAAIDKHIKQKHKLTDEEFLQVKIISCMDYISSLEESIAHDMNLIEKIVAYVKRTKDRLQVQQALLDQLNQELESLKEGENSESEH